MVTEYRPGKHRDDGAFPFPDSYPMHEYGLTASAATWLQNVEQRDDSVREALWSMLTANTPGLVCFRCGYSYRDLLCLEDIEQMFGAVCLPRPHVVAAIGRCGHDVLGTVTSSCLEELVSPQFEEWVKIKAEVMLKSILAGGGLGVLVGRGHDGLARGWISLNRDE